MAKAESPDLELIDKLTPREIARTGYKIHESFDENARLTIEGRKEDLLRYIQTICRDHLIFGQRAIDEYWKADRRKRKQASK